MPDVVLRMLAILVYATPVFFVGMLLKLVFSVWLGWLPVAGRGVHRDRIGRACRPQTHIYDRRRDPLRQRTYIVDVLSTRCCRRLALGLLTGGIFLRLVRTNMMQTLRAGYVDAARSRGRQRAAS